LLKLIHQVEKILKDADRENARVVAEVIGARPAGEIPADHPLVTLAMSCVSGHGLEAVLTAGSTDANIPLSRGIPAVVMGISTGGGAHTLNEYLDLDPIMNGIESVTQFVEMAATSGQ
jgi:acetylornithine deacetylase/succinyl-diaminopimelate desuccinylase-like protein